MFLKIIALLLCITYAARAEYVRSVDCVNTTLHTQNVRMEVSECTAAHVECPLYRGYNHTVVFTFEAVKSFMNKTDARVYGVFPQFTVPYGKKTDACAASVATEDGASCSSLGGFVEGKEYQHRSIFPVSPNYPLLHLRVKFVFYDRKTKVNLMCIELPVEIKNPPTAENEA